MFTVTFVSDRGSLRKEFATKKLALKGIVDRTPSGSKVNTIKRMPHGYVVTFSKVAA